MPDYTVKWPLELNQTTSGFETIDQESINELVRFNLKNILLTVPGERIMDPNFGVGIKMLLFEQSTSIVTTDIKSKIRDQIRLYASYVQIEGLEITFQDDNRMNIILKYHVPASDIKDVLDLTVTS